MILRGYIDESYSPKVFSLSCVMSNPSGWMHLESAWKKCLRAKNKSLKKQGRPEISRYHAADCSSRVGEFRGWTTEEQIELTKKLVGIFHRNPNWANVIAYSVPMDEFARQFPEYNSDLMGFCYWTLIKFLMIEMAEQVLDIQRRKRSTTPVRFVLFHDRCQYDGVLLDAFNRAINDSTFKGREMFSTIEPLSSQECIPLQLADLVAYENFKDTEGFLVGRKRRKTLEALLETENYGGRSRRFDAKSINALRHATFPDQYPEFAKLLTSPRPSCGDAPEVTTSRKS